MPDSSQGLDAAPTATARRRCEKRRRSRLVGVRLSEREYATLASLAERSGASLAEVVRYALRAACVIEDDPDATV